jgi:OmpA-OmpF porin, OOP family
MRKLLMRTALVLFAAVPGVPGAEAAEFFNQDWLLNTSASRIYMGTVKANATFETHHFSSIDGTISRNGDATVKIDLASLETNHDLRNTRMRFLLFETYKFPHAEITAKLDKSRLQDLLTRTRIAYPLKFTLNLHGVVKEMEAPVWVTRISDSVVTVSSIQPIIVTAEAFNLTAGIGKLMEAIAPTVIAPGTSITFDLMFASGSYLPELEAARAEAVRRGVEMAAAPIAPDACETRFSVISTAQAIYFKVASAELDRESDPLLASVADIAKRCPGVKVEVTGHTDSDGGRDFNQHLSEERARSVVTDLLRRGVTASQIWSIGYGASRPVVPNDSLANKAKNRRIEFIVKKSS